MSSGTIAADADAGGEGRPLANPSPAAVERAIVETVAYADVFDFPLTADEIQRYLIGVVASQATVSTLLSRGAGVGAALERSGPYFFLAGRDSTVAVRRDRMRDAEAFWPRAVRYGRQLARLPFVRMVAVTGALAVDNIADGDIDYLVVTEPGRLWLCRALIVGLVRAAAVRGTELCPNYLLSERALALAERNLFTAHEVAQMVPLAGLDAYRRLRDLNRWTDRYLPNARQAPHRHAAVDVAPGRVRRTVEGALRSRLGSPLERWEMERKIRKLGRRSSGHDEAAFGPDWCKGHFGDHGQLTLARYNQRLQALDSIHGR